MTCDPSYSQCWLFSWPAWPCWLWPSFLAVVFSPTPGRLRFLLSGQMGCFYNVCGSLDFEEHVRIISLSTNMSISRYHSGPTWAYRQKSGTWRQLVSNQRYKCLPWNRLHLSWVKCKSESESVIVKEWKCKCEQSNIQVPAVKSPPLELGKM